MLEALLGSVNRERVLMYLFARNEGYAREIARYYKSDLDPIQKQLERLEQGQILFSRNIGRTRLYSFNPRYPFLKELGVVLEKAFSFYSKDERENLALVRRRPRRKNKPI
jgi:hypothetical protein